MHISMTAMATDSAVTALSVATIFRVMRTLLPLHCHFHCCHNAVLAFAVPPSVKSVILGCVK